MFRSIIAITALGLALGGATHASSDMERAWGVCSVIPICQTALYHDKLQPREVLACQRAFARQEFRAGQTCSDALARLAGY